VPAYIDRIDDEQLERYRGRVECRLQAKAMMRHRDALRQDHPQLARRALPCRGAPLLAAVLATAAGIAALVLPRRNTSPSFWCGILAAPVFVVLGTISLVVGATALNG